MNNDGKNNRLEKLLQIKHLKFQPLSWEKTIAEQSQAVAAAQTMKKLNTLIDSAPDVREAMVVKLRTDIENGNYRVNVEKVAERMLERAIKDSLYKDR